MWCGLSGSAATHADSSKLMSRLAINYYCHEMKLPALSNSLLTKASSLLLSAVAVAANIEVVDGSRHRYFPIRGMVNGNGFIFTRPKIKTHHEKFCVFVVTDVWLVKLCCCFSVANRKLIAEQMKLLVIRFNVHQHGVRYLFAAQSCALCVTSGRASTHNSQVVSKTQFALSSILNALSSPLSEMFRLKRAPYVLTHPVKVHTVRKCIAIDFPHRSCALSKQGITFYD